ncbi:MAG TPA: tetratricopeptide repeat protein [Bryobacteraceae bacterium]|nr:tetratricopeptide repeat protein [Bryobacteraceae bacterium]
MYFSGPPCLLLLILVLLLPASCGQKAQAIAPPRYAVLRFENLSGDPSLDWVGRAVSESLPVSLAGVLDGPVLESEAFGRLAATLGPRPAGAPGESAERSEAMAAGATHTISGYIERIGGKIRISATEEDLSTNKSVRTLTASAPSPLAAIQDLARQFSPNAHPGLTANEAALNAYSTAFEAAAQTKPGELDRALELDPNFGAAWVALAGFDAASGDRAKAEEVMDRARKQQIDARSRANIEFGEASLKGDRPASLAAMRRIVELSPGDTILLRSLAESESAAGDFKSAAADWKKAIDVLPNDALAWNSLGYARSWAGDYAGALAAFREYERLRPKEANPLDSIGDLNYSFGKYAAAAENYLEANKRQPGFEQFADLYKAAWAKFRAGDKAGADALFAQFRKERGKSPDPLLGLLEGDWLYRTGREKEAADVVNKMIAASQSGPVRADAYAQLTIWDLLGGDRDKAARDSAAIGQAATPAVFMARFAALPSAPAAEWKTRAEKMLPATAETLRLTAEGYALLLDHQREAAIPVWQDVVKSTSATDFFGRAILARLKGQPIARSLVPDPTMLNQFAALLDTL